MFVATVLSIGLAASANTKQPTFQMSCLRDTETSLTGQVNVTPSIDVDDVRRLVEASAPKTIQKSGKERKKVLFANVTVGWTVTGHRQSTSVTPSQGAVSASVVYRVTGSAEGIPLSARLQLTANIPFQLGEDWCPSTHIDVTHRWLKPPTARILGIDITFKSLADPAVASIKAQLRREYAKAVECRPFRANLDRLLSRLVAARPLPGTACLAYFVPTRAIRSDVQHRNGRLDLPAQIAGTFRIVSKSAPNVPPPLPPLTYQKAIPNGRSMLVLRTPWSTVSDLVEQHLCSEPYELKDGLNLVLARLELLTTQVSGSQDRLAMNSDIRFTPSDHQPGRGRVAISIRPYLEQGRIRLADPQVTFAMDRYRSFGSKLQSKAQRILSQKVSLDAQSSAQRAFDRLKQSFEGSHPGASIQVAPVRIEKVSIHGKELQLHASTVITIALPILIDVKEDDHL